MTIREKVAIAIMEANHGVKGHAAITAFLKATAEEGWRMLPLEATETMRKAGRQNSGDERGRTGGPGDAFEVIWRAMLAAADEFEWEHPSQAIK